MTRDERDGRAGVRNARHQATVTMITVGATTDNPERVQVEVRDRDVTDAAMDASWARIRTGESS